MLRREYAARVLDQNVVDRLLAHAVALQARNEVLQNVAIAEAAVPGQHHLEEHVLRHQDRVEVAVVDQTANGDRVLLVAGRLRLLIGVEVVHADHVVLDERAAISEALLVLRIVQARVHVAQDGVPEVCALLLDDVEHPMRQALPTRQVDGQRRPAEL